MESKWEENRLQKIPLEPKSNKKTEPSPGGEEKGLQTYAKRLSRTFPRRYLKRGNALEHSLVMMMEADGDDDDGVDDDDDDDHNDDDNEVIFSAFSHGSAHVR